MLEILSLQDAHCNSLLGERGEKALERLTNKFVPPLSPLFHLRDVSLGSARKDMKGEQKAIIREEECRQRVVPVIITSPSLP